MGFTPEQLTLLYWLTILIIIIKISLVTYLAVKLYQKSKEQPLKLTDFFVGLLILLVALTISRLFYFYFDFYLTHYDTALYLVGSNLVYWRIGATIVGLGGAYLLGIVDKEILKLKGLLGYILAVIAVLHLFYPVNTLDDFIILSTIGTIGGVVFLIIPIVFVWLGIKDPSIRKTSFLIALGAAFYGTAAILMSESTLDPLENLFGAGIRTGIIIASVILRIIGLSILCYGSTKLKIS
jgi:hypothetical protein